MTACVALHIEVRSHPGASCHLTGNGERRKDGRPDIYAPFPLLAGELLHVHLAEDLREELHAMIVVYGHKLVILAAGDLMGNLLAINDGCHAVFHVLSGLLLMVSDRLDSDVADTDLPAMGAFAEPALAGRHVIDGLTPDTADAKPLVLLFLEDRLLHDQIGHILGDDRLRTETALLQPDVLQRGGGEREPYRLPALQHLHRDLSLIVLPDDGIDDIKPRGNRYVLERSCCQGRQFVLPEVIDQVTVDGGGFHGERPGPFVHDDAVTGQNLVQLVLREIHVGGDELGVRLRLLGRCRTRLDLGNDVPEFNQHVLSGACAWLPLYGLASLVVEAVTAVLKLARLDPAVRTVGNEGSPAVSEFTAYTAQVVSFLGTRRPAEHATAGPQVHQRTGSPAVFPLADPVTVQAHRDAPVGVACVDVVLRQVEVPAHDHREGVVGLPVR